MGGLASSPDCVAMNRPDTLLVMLDADPRGRREERRVERGRSMVIVSFSGCGLFSLSAFYMVGALNEDGFGFGKVSFDEK